MYKFKVGDIVKYIGYDQSIHGMSFKIQAIFPHLSEKLYTLSSVTTVSPLIVEESELTLVTPCPPAQEVSFGWNPLNTPQQSQPVRNHAQELLNTASFLNRLVHEDPIEYTGEPIYVACECGSDKYYGVDQGPHSDYCRKYAKS